MTVVVRLPMNFIPFATLDPIGKLATFYFPGHSHTWQPAAEPLIPAKPLSDVYKHVGQQSVTLLLIRLSALIDTDPTPHIIMADFAPPSGPPPPRVPEGWKAVWNAQYNEWFYVNLHTKASQWDKPTEPAYAAPTGGPPPGAPPGYDHGASRTTGPEKGGYGNDPYGHSNMSEDERYARKLQEEENASRGMSDSYYQQGSSAPQYGQSPAYGQSAGYGQSPGYGQSSSPYGQQQQQLPAREEKSRGLLGKLTSKLGGGSSSARPYGQQGYPQQQYGGYPQQQAYGYQQGYAQQQPQKQHHGMGAGGGALMGAGAGLVGGALLADAFEDHGGDGGDDGGDDGGGDGGGDFGGGDGGGFGGDDGGGDMGGGDF